MVEGPVSPSGVGGQFRHLLIINREVAESASASVASSVRTATGRRPEPSESIKPMEDLEQ